MHFHPFARPIIGLQGGFYFAPPPPPTPPITFLMIFSLSIILPWVPADVLKLILGISSTDLWSQATY